jgi:uncharacterized metal-binding protein
VILASKKLTDATITEIITLILKIGAIIISPDLDINAYCV